MCQSNISKKYVKYCYLLGDVCNRSTIANWHRDANAVLLFKKDILSMLAREGNTNNSTLLSFICTFLSTLMVIKLNVFITRYVRSQDWFYHAVFTPFYSTYRAIRLEHC